MDVNQQSIAVQTNSIVMSSNSVVIDEAVSLQMNSTRSSHS